jgi:hypothetical protein
VSLALAPATATASSFTWSGRSTSSANWSAQRNWAGEVAPASSSTIETLEFPSLTSPTCASSEPTMACYLSFNNLPGITVESLHIDDAEEYVIAGEALTLGSGGLSAAPHAETSELTLSALLTPIVLGASQTWHIAGFDATSPVGENQLYVGEGMTGDHELTVDLSEGGALDFGGDNEVGALAIDGANPSKVGVFNGLLGLFGARLNATDGNPVSVNHVFLYGAGSIGPLTTTDAQIDVAIGGEPLEGTLEAAGVTLDAASTIGFEIANDGTNPSSDYSRLVSDGAIALGGATIRVAGPQSCTTLPLGRTYTLVSTTGGLVGAFGNSPEGGEIPLLFPKECGKVLQKLRLSYHESGLTQTVTGTVIAGVTSTTTLATSPSAPMTNQTVKLTATVRTDPPGLASGTVEFQNGGATIAGCGSKPVTAGVAVCETSFTATSSPEHLSATFTPDFAANLVGSTTSETSNLTVAPDATSTWLRVSNSTPSIGMSVTYTATISPADFGPWIPTGTVEFLDAEHPIESCASQPLALGGAPSNATCQLSYQSDGAHSITARYRGDANFAASFSTPDPVTVTTPHPFTLPAGEQQVAGASEESGGVSLASATVATQGGIVALVKLHCTAPGGCHGTLALSTPASTKDRHGKRRTRTISLGSGSFTITGGQTTTVKIKLSAAARALLHSDRGRISARLTILDTAAGHEQTQVKAVRIVEQTASRSKSKHGVRRL